jgi:Membrane-bound metallopeptidase
MTPPELIDKLRKVAVCVHLATEPGPAKDIEETCLAAVTMIETLGEQGEQLAATGRLVLALKAELAEAQQQIVALHAEQRADVARWNQANTEAQDLIRELQQEIEALKVSHEPR